MSDEAQSTLLRSVRVLFGLAEAGRPMTVTRLATVLSLPASTTHRILNVLRQADYVMQDEETGAYSPGPAFLRVATVMVASSTFPASVNDALRLLVDGSGESAFYGAYLEQVCRMRFIANLHSHHAIQYVMRTDQTYSVLWGASGRSIASQLPESTLRVIYDREKEGGEGIVPLPAWDTFLQWMRDTRATGYSVSDGQRYEGSHAMAAPVFGANGAVIGCIGISMPLARKDPQKTARCIELVNACATQLTRAARSFAGRQEERTAFTMP
ncbi:MAG TPA: IclR family transcriptional regulator [Bordetella sp.]|jgi:DNA-binding IclR family transcriptional regulator|nr:IclR family transcriptional regulator [Bordetella sp.]